MAEPQYLTGSFDTDLKVLLLLDDSDLEKLCQTNTFLATICSSPKLWSSKIIKKFGEDAWTRLLPYVQKSSAQQIYLNFSRYPRSITGANTALIRADHPSSLLFELSWLYPNINKDIDDPSMNHPGFDRFFLIPKELLSYLNKIQLGPIVSANFSSQKFSNLFSLSNTRLQDVIYSLQPEINGESNPLYGIFNTDLLASIFLLMADVQKWRQNGNFRMPEETRIVLRTILEEMYDKQVLSEVRFFPSGKDEILRLGAQYKESITNSNIQIKAPIGSRFVDLDNFRFNDLLEIVNATKIIFRPPVDFEDKVERLYSWLFQTPVLNTIRAVLTIESRTISAARNRLLNQ